MRKMLIALLVATLAVPATALAAPTVEELQQQIQALQEQLNAIASQVKESEAAPAAEIEEDVEDLMARVDKVERKTALDRINWYGDLRAKADSLVYKGITVNQGMLVDYAALGNQVNMAVPVIYSNPAEFPGPPLSGFNNPPVTDPNSGVTQTDVDSYWRAYSLLTQGLPAMSAAYPDFAAAFMAGQLPAQGMFGNGPTKYDADNSILYTTRLRLGMKADVWDNVSFSGRLNMYKGWGDSTGVKVFDSFNSFTMDGTDSGNTTGDFLRVERAYFDWKDIGDTPFYLSIGRRPSTYGPPTHFRENEQRGGTPTGHLVNFNFDGITVGYHLSEHTGIEGQTVRFCYGQGFESEFGNGSLFTETDLDDTHMAGLNIDAYNDGTTFVQMTAFRAFDIVDSFKGLAVMPFADTNGDNVPDTFNNNGYITRMQGSENIGDMNLVGIGLTREEDNGLNWFGSFGWTRTEPNANYNPMGLGGLLYDATPVMQITGINVDENGNFESVDMEATGDYVKSNNWDKDRDGYSVYVGVQIPAWMGKVGLEYNYGSKYWTPFTQAQDDIVGSKLATRGHAGEAYYIFDINPKMFIKVGGIYYDYEYTGSGSPVGLPKKVKDVQDGSEYSMFPVLDKVWDVNASLTVKF